jgi:hypothetical protein
MRHTARACTVQGGNVAEILTAHSAALTVKSWLENRAELPSARTQRRWLLEEVGRLCAAEAIAKGYDEDQLWTHLNEAEEILQTL